MQDVIIPTSDVKTTDYEQIRCSAGRLGSCQKCETCCMRRRISDTKQWFPKLGDKTRKDFMMLLVESCTSVDVLETILMNLKPFDFKDFTYSRSRLQPGNRSDLATSESDHSLSKQLVNKTLGEYARWFKNSSPWSKINFLFILMQMCESHHLHIIKNQIRTTYEVRKGLQNRPMTSSTYCQSQLESRPQTPGGLSVTGTDGERSRPQSGIHWSDSAHAINDDFGPKVTKRMSEKSLTYRSKTLENDFEGNFLQICRFPSAKEVQFTSPPQSDSSAHCYRQYENCELNKVMKSKSPETTGRIPFGRRSFKPAVVDMKLGSTSRCSPYIEKESLNAHEGTKQGENSASEDYMSCDDQDFDLYSEVASTTFSYAGVSRFKDFIRCLPVFLSKYIISMLDTTSRTNCLCVSTHWRFLVEEVQAESEIGQTNQEDVMLIGGSSGRCHNPKYARNVQIHVLKVGQDGDPLPNDEPKHVNIDNGNSALEARDMQWCYDGYETETFELEERNVYCGAYNIMVLNDQKDTGRVTYYGGGNYVPIGSFDRKIKVMNMNAAKYERVIHGHAGSIKSLLVDESQGVIISGSYDTSVRCWDIKTGKCTMIFRGHRGSVICLSLYGSNLASGSIDKTVKVWNMRTGKCRRTFKHRKMVKAIAIDDQYLVTGCWDGKARLWDFEAGTMVKVLSGHFDALTSVKFDPYHIVTGGLDCYVMVWSKRTTFKKCLQSFKHPKEVLCLEMMFRRIISGAADGKIRIWNILTGECLRVLRGNSKNDAIVAVYAMGDRMLVNTRSNLLLYKFEQITWDYNGASELGGNDANFRLPSNRKVRSARSYSRAMRMRTQGSLLHTKEKVAEGYDEVKRRTSAISKCETGGAPDSRTSNRLPLDTIARVKSAPSLGTRKSMSTHIQRIKSAQVRCNGTANAQHKDQTTKGHLVRKYKRQSSLPSNGEIIRETTTPHSPLYSNCDSAMATSTLLPTYVARSRSAPALRLKTLPVGARGLTSNSEVPVRVAALVPPSQDRTLVPKPPTRSKAELAYTVVAQSPTERFGNLRLKSYYQQMEFEENLRQVPIGAQGTV